MAVFGWRLIRIAGDSMWPAWADGDYALVGPFEPGRDRAGTTVLVDHPRFGAVVKSLGEVNDAGYALRGLAPWSTPSEVLGRVRRDRILGRVVRRLGSTGGRARPRSAARG